MDDEPARPLRTAAELAALLDQVGSALAFLDRELRFRYINAAIESWTGCAAADVFGRSTEEVLGPDLAARSAPLMARALEGAPQHFEQVIRVPDGRVMHMWTNYVPVRHDGTVVGFLVHSRDISEEVRTERISLELAARLAAARERERIAEAMDEALAGRLSDLVDGLSGVAVEERLRRSLTAAGQLLRTTLAEVHSIGATTSRSLVDGFDDAVREVIAAATPALGFTPSLTMHRSVDGADASMLLDLLAVLTEALSNVARHAGASEVHVDLRHVYGHLSVRVTDDGRGIRAATRRSGLTNMRVRAARHGGACRWYDARGAGTVLRWWVPTGRVDAADTPDDADAMTQPVEFRLSPVLPSQPRPSWTGLGTGPLLEVLDHLPPMLTVWDVDGRNMFANRTALDRIHAASRDEIEGRHMAQVLGEGVWTSVQPMLERAGRPPYRSVQQTFDGPRNAAVPDVRHVAAICTPWVRTGQLQGFTFESNDVTTRVETIAGLEKNELALAVLQERRRIAEDLHDVAIQQLFAVGLQLQSARGSAEPGDAVFLDRAIDTIDESIVQLRASIVDLRSGSG